jgi:hypothetical protein
MTTNVVPLFADRAAPVDVEAARRVATVPCSTCGLDAPRVMAGAGVDLHECARLHYTQRRHCCGLVANSSTSAAYRADAVCPRCGVDRFGLPAPFVELTGGVSLAEISARCRGVETDGIHGEE